MARRPDHLGRESTSEKKRSIEIVRLDTDHLAAERVRTALCQHLESGKRLERGGRSRGNDDADMGSAIRRSNEVAHMVFEEVAFVGLRVQNEAPAHLEGPANA